MPVFLSLEGCVGNSDSDDEVSVCRRTPGRGFWLGRGAIEVRAKFQNNPNNFFVFSLFQVGGIGALAKPHFPPPLILFPQSGAREISYRGQIRTFTTPCALRGREAAFSEHTFAIGSQATECTVNENLLS